MQYILLILVNCSFIFNAFSQVPLYIIDPKNDSYNSGPFTACKGTTVVLKTAESVYWKGMSVSLYQSVDNATWGEPIQTQIVEQNSPNGNMDSFTFIVTPTETSYYRIIYSLGGISESVRIILNENPPPAPSVVVVNQNCSAITLSVSGHDAGYTWYCQRYMPNGTKLGFTEMPGETGSTLTTSAQSFDYDYRVAYTDPLTGCSSGSNIVNVNSFGVAPYLCTSNETVTNCNTYIFNNFSMVPFPIRNECNKLVAEFYNASSGVASVDAQVTFDVSVRLYSGQPYVQKHYDFKSSSPLNGSSTLTLYFTQAEFDAFNAVSAVRFPISPSDSEGYKTNVRVLQTYGTATSANPGPEDYTGGTEFKAPLDVYWDSTLQCWAVTITVSDFSGFFLAAPKAPMPVTLRYVNAQSTEEIIDLTWATSSESLFKQYDVERSQDPKTGFDYIATVTPKADATAGEYVYHDQAVQAGTYYYYRLKMIDLDGSVTYSKLVSAKLTLTGSIRVFPNPAHRDLTVTCAEPIVSYQLIGLTGLTQLMQSGLDSNRVSLTLPELPTGVYVLQLTTKSGATERRKVVIN